MVQLGELIAAPIFFSEEDHNEKTCPWHEEAPKADAKPMEKPDPETDTAAPSMPENDGGTLGRYLEKSGKKKPEHTLTLEYAPDELLTYKKNKSVQTYIDKKTETYKLQYAPHHLIPGNESLSESLLLAYLGDANVIKNFNKKKLTSKIKDNQTVGYDVNAAENGVWLPSPYALSMSNQWPSIPGKEYILKIKGKEVLEVTVSFQKAYVAAAIHESGDCQFHMRHSKYSAEVRDVLDGIAGKLKLMTKGVCEIASNKKNDDKFEAPTGLVSRLNVLSKQLERLLTGPSWHAPFFADDNLMTDYVTTLEFVEGLKPTIEHIL